MSYTWAVTSGSLPAGLSLNPFTGEISGVPAVAGVSTFDLMVTDPAGGASQATFTLTITPRPGPPQITPGALAGGFVGQSYRETIPHSGGCQPVYLTVGGGVLPPGLMLDVVTGVVSGIPRTAGKFGAAILATEASGIETNAPVSIDITGSAPPEIKLTGRIFGPFVPGDAFAFTLDATGGTPPYQYFLNNPPPGFTLTGDTIFGIAISPPVIETLDIDISDAGSNSGRVTIFHLVLDPQPNDPQIILSAQDWIIGQSVNVMPTVSGGAPPLTFSWSPGPPPPGIGIDSATGRVFGTPVVPGESAIPLLVKDANGRVGAIVVPLVIHAGFPGGYPAWKSYYGVASSSEDLEPDTFQALGEYYMGLKPNVRDSASLYSLRKQASGLYLLDFPAAGVPDAHADLQLLDPVTLQWQPFFSNPFPPLAPKAILRVKFGTP